MNGLMRANEKLKNPVAIDKSLTCKNKDRMIVRKKEWMKIFHQFGWQHGKYRPENINNVLGIFK